MIEVLSHSFIFRCATLFEWIARKHFGYDSLMRFNWASKFMCFFVSFSKLILWTSDRVRRESNTFSKHQSCLGNLSIISINLALPFSHLSNEKVLLFISFVSITTDTSVDAIAKISPYAREYPRANRTRYRVLLWVERHFQCVYWHKIRL